MIEGHGGNVYAMARQLGCQPEEILDMSSNINPLGMPPGLQTCLQDHVDCIGMLPEADASTAGRNLAALLNVDACRVLAGNGTTQFIYSACAAVKMRKALIVGPTYADYADACRMHGIEPQYFLTHAGTGFEVDLAQLGRQIPGYHAVFICNPNNPTGRGIPVDALADLCRTHPQTHFIVDESYLPFSPGYENQSMAHCRLENVSVLWSMSKIFGVPGLRAGFLIAGENTVSRFKRFMQPWSMNSMAQAAMDYLGNHRSAVDAFITSTRDFLMTERQRFANRLDACQALTVFPSETSYLLIGLRRGLNAQTVCAHMAKARILIRNCSNFYGLSDSYVRVALKDEDANRSAARKLKEAAQGVPRP